MKLKITPSTVEGKLTIPSSKSHSIRALLFALLAKGRSTITNLLDSPDIEHTIDACRKLGAIITHSGDKTYVDGGDLTSRDLIDVGNSGIAYRFLTAIAALGSTPTIITGDHSIQTRRPIAPLTDALTQLGATILGDRAPLTICGPLHSGITIVEGSDSQFVSALLMAAPFASGPIEVFVLHPGELPWVQLTLDWLTRLNIPFKSDHYTYFRFEGNTQLQPFSYSVPGDFSTSAFPVAAALLSNTSLHIQNLDADDSQGDKHLFSILKQMGANIELHSHGITVKPGGTLIGRTINMNPIIDALPIVAVLACFAEGETRLTHAAIARTKECDRITAVAQELRKMGASIQEHPDGLTIQGSTLQGACLNAHSDHRMGMALTVAAMAASSPSSIEDATCIAKTYPKFVDNFCNLGAKIS